MTQSILNGFLIFSIIQSFIFLGLFVTKKNRISADFVMSLWLFLFAVHSLLILINLNFDSSVILRILPVNLTLLYGPLLLFYINTRCSSYNKLKSKLFLHLIPFVVFFVLTFILLNNNIFQKILSISGAVSGMLYCLLTLFYTRKHEWKIIDLYSNTEGISLGWLNKLLIGIVLVWISVFILIVTKQVFQASINLHWFFVLIPFCISYIGYHGLKQQIIFQETSLTENNLKLKTQKIPDNTVTVNNHHSSYKKSGLSEQDMKRVFNTLEHFMKTDKLYLIPNLNLRDLANKTQMPQHHITQTLNSFAKKSFYDYINAYRVNEFIDKLEKGEADNFSLLGIAFDCGFNSKSTFNRIFKKTTGFSPSEYKKILH